jgi:hypothetical protein
MHNPFRLKPLAAALLVSLAASNPVFATEADHSLNEQVTVSAGRQVTPHDEAVISSTAAKVLRHIADARGELQGEKPNGEKAKDDLEQSQKLLDIIQSALPTTKVKDRIWVAKKHLEYEDTREVLPDLVPIYASLDELVDYVPTAKAKAHVDEAKKALEKGDKPKAAERLQAADDALLYVEADLPLKATRHLISAAIEDLAKNDTKAADKALVSAEGNVVFVSVSIDAPMTHAKAALWRAWQDNALGEKAYAKADLDEAVKYLERAAQSKDPIERKAAEGLVTDVRDLHELLANGDKGFSARIESTWHRVKALSERSAEHVSTGWQRLRTEGAGKQDLIEAKLQVAYARIDHVYSKDDAAAKVDLSEAKGYLDGAAKEANAATKGSVEEISTMINELDKALNDGDGTGANAAAFEKAEANLGKLIRQI